MDHISRPRPSLPGATPVMLSNSNRNAYSSSNDHNHKAQSSGAVATEKGQQVNNSQIRMASKLISKLPFELRESMGAAFDTVIQQAELACKESQILKTEVITLQTEISHKTSEYSELEKIAEVYRQKISALENKLDDMQDNMESRQKYLVKNRRSVDRMASTNRMLIDSLNSLQQTTLNVTSGPIDQVPTAGNQGPTTGMSDKLRESLLRVSREHYASIKKVEILEQSVDNLKASLKSAEQRNRQLKLAIDELQSHHSDSHHSVHFIGNIVSPSPGHAEASGGPATGTWGDYGTPLQAVPLAKSPINSKPSAKLFGKMDDKLQGLVAKQALDPTEGLITLRRLLVCIANAPTSLMAADTIQYLASRDLMRIFEAEMVCVFLVPFHSSKNIVHKFTPRSREPEVINLTGSDSLVGEVLRNHQAVRINSMSRTQFPFDSSIDSCPGLTVRRVLSMPLFDPKNGALVGVIHLLNKSRSGVVYSEADEVFAQILADHSAGLITSCLAHEMHNYRTQTLASLLDVAAELYEVIPNEVLKMAQRDLTVADILRKLEELCKSSLKCSKSRAFVLEGEYKGSQGNYSSGELITLNRRGISLSKKSRPEVLKVSDFAGIVGRCAKTREWISMNLIDTEELMAAEADLDPQGLPMLTVPVLNVTDTLIGVLQLVPGVDSPQLLLEDSKVGLDTISFQHAVSWFLHQISQPLDYLLNNPKSTLRRPKSIPSRLNSAVQITNPDAVEPVTVEEASEIDKASSNGLEGFELLQRLKVATSKLKSELALFPKLEQSASERHGLEIEELLYQIVDMVQISASKLSVMQSELQKEKLAVQMCASELRDATKSYAISIEDLNGQIEELKDQVSTGDKQLRSLQALSQEKQLSKSEIEKDRLELSSTLEKEFNDKIESMTQTQHASIKELRNKIDDREIQISKLRKTISSLGNEVEELTVANTSQKGIIAELNRRLIELAVIRDQLTDTHERDVLELQSLREALTEKDASITTLKTELSLAAVAVNTNSFDEVISQPRPIASTRSTCEDRDNSIQKVEVNSSWLKKTDSNGADYYINDVAGESRWELPFNDAKERISNCPKGEVIPSAIEAPIVAQQETVRVGDWIQVVDTEGLSYWYNEITNESQWEIPVISKLDSEMEEKLITDEYFIDL